MSKRRILIISGEAWRDESNGGNVLSNLFAPLAEDYEFAQIYTNAALPSNKLCTHYFHLSESEMLQTVFKQKPFGSILSEKDLNKKDEEKPYHVGTNFSLIKKFLLNTAFLLQDLLWRFSKWKTPQLKQFILDYDPDLIFAPMYYGIHLHRLDRYVAKLTDKPLVSYVSDDHLTFKQFSFSPIYWFNRLILIHNVKSTAKHYSLLYTMTQEQLNEYEPILKVPMKVLKKAGDFKDQPKYSIDKNQPFVISYGGNLIYNRFETLAKLAQAVRVVNKNKKHFILNIYSQTPITTEIKLLLHDEEHSFLKGKVTLKELELAYANSDILLHVESFNLKQKLLTRLSFSTKIIDLLHSGRCIMAICWNKSSPYLYLKNEDAALCVDNVSSIEEVLTNILDDPSILEQYAEKAWNCGLRNHNREQVIFDFKKDIESLIV